MEIIWRIWLSKDYYGSKNYHFPHSSEGIIKVNSSEIAVLLSLEFAKTLL